jgi:hypothetical protein
MLMLNVGVFYVGSYSDNNKKACFFKEKAPQIVGGAY